MTSDLSALDSSGFWAVVVPFDGAPTCARFATIRPARRWTGRPWIGPDRSEWRTSLDRAAFVAGVETIRSEIAAGDVYQVNLTRRLSAPLPRPTDGTTTDIAALGAALAEGNPAPFSAVVRLPDHGVHVASASPERFLARAGDAVVSSPIKGTAARVDDFLDKDRAENVMIVDLVRNDLGRVCDWGSVTVPSLMAVEEHPGLVHLVSTVTGRLRSGVGWEGAIAATFPPGSVTGAPKLAALDSIARLEPVERGIYCGAIGWVDADARRGDLNVAIRTFWIEDDLLHFGTGGGITYDSDPEGEWAETELKAANLLSVAAGARPRPGLRRRCQHVGMTSGPSDAIVWINGEMADPATATVSWADHGITVGDGVFETIKIDHGRPFALSRHLRRFHRSATMLGLDFPDEALLRDAALTVSAAWGDRLGRLRMTLTGGPGPLGSSRGDAEPTLIVAAAPLTIMNEPTDVIVVPWPRNERGALAGVKSTSYAENVMALARAAEADASEAIFANTVGNLCEGTGSNVFVGTGDRLVTPPLSAGPLAGITRELLLEALDEAGSPAFEVDLTMDAFLDADEAFLLSTGREVQPIRRVDGLDYRECPGPLTQAASKIWSAAFSHSLDP